MKINQIEIEKVSLKKRLMQSCIKVIEGRIAAIVKIMENAQANANAEEKSSAGDKYETSRAMSHLEKDMQSRQLAANRNELAALFGIDCSVVYDLVKPGSFIRCTDCSFFVAAGLGKVQFEGEDIYLLSPGAPLAKLLYTKKQNDIITFNKKEMTILELFNPDVEVETCLKLLKLANWFCYWATGQFISVKKDYSMTTFDPLATLFYGEYL